ncbi:MAG: PQQ-dependent sugar dehydrogenase [Pirellulales bacterium]|nr:PQQ-dependent sugar dehydrogenase [Pirellulales bacterium]
MNLLSILANRIKRKSCTFPPNRKAPARDRKRQSLIEKLEDRWALATVPTGFTDSTLVTGLTSPTALTIAPDGRVFVAFQNGTIRVMQNDVMLATPFATLATDGSGERGMLGLTLDPDFATNGHIYVYYTASTPASHNRLSRITAVGNEMLPGSEQILLDLPNLSTVGNPIWHMGGAVHYNPVDDKIYIAVGDHQNTSLPQSLNSPFGKILRVNPDGSIPTDNPFYNQTTGINRAIYNTGLRNPFRAAIQPETGLLYINDVGAGSWEEVNASVAGANFGWPTTEGNFNQATFPNFTRPIYAYSHGEGCSVTGGVFYPQNALQFPAQYRGKYFVQEFCSGWMRVIDPLNPTAPPQAFASNMNFPLDVQVGPDGSMYYISRGAGAGGAPGVGTGSIGKIQYVANVPAYIVQHPTNQLASVGFAATFSVTSSGTLPLTHQWQRSNDNGATWNDIPGATASGVVISNTTLADNGAQFRVIVTNAFGMATSNPATLTVTSNQPPVPTITLPSNGTLYSGGDMFNFSGIGTDNEDGNLPASAFTWRIDFHHDDHSHPFYPTTSGVTGGSFTIPNTGETSDNVWYRVFLSVTDSIGLQGSTYIDVLPRKSDMTFNTNIPGLTINLDGAPRTLPLTVTGVEGIQRTLFAPSLQFIGNQAYQFVNWSNGGSQSQTITTPVDNTTYTANYAATTVVFVSDLPFVGTPTNGWGPVERDRSNGETGATDGNTITLNGRTYAKGLGVHSNGEVIISLAGGGYDRFVSDVGVDDETGPNGTVVFQVYGDNTLLFQSNVLNGSSASESVDVSVVGYNQLRLVINDAGDGNGSDHGDWAGAALLTTPVMAPSAPSGLSATANTATQITVNWTDNSSNESGFRIERSPDGSSGWTEVGNTNAGITSFADTTVLGGGTYYYRARAYNAGGNSAYTNTASATTPDQIIGTVKVNFQPATVPVPNGYIADTGIVYGNRGNGYFYGWNATNNETRDREVNPDQRYDTLNHMQKPTNPTASWEIGLPRGVYRVFAVTGDPSNFDGSYDLQAEGTTFVQGTPNEVTRFYEGTRDVTVLDGRLTLTSGPTAQNNKINFVDIERLPIIPGTTAGDVILIRTAATAGIVQVFDNAAATGTPFFSAPLAALGTLTVNAGAGNDQIIVDMTFGNPIPTGGLIINGEADDDTLTVIGQNTLAAGRIITFNAGGGTNTLNMAAKAARVETTAVGGTLDTTVDYDAQLTTSSIKQRSLTIASDSSGNGGLVTILPHGGAAGLVKLDALSIGLDGTLELNDNDLILTYVAPGPNPALTSLVQSYIINGINNESFAPRVTSAFYTSTGGQRLLVALDNTAGQFGDVNGSPFNGEILGDSTNMANPGFNQVLIKFTYPGDYNLDGQVDASDYVVVDSNIGTSTAGGLSGWIFGDGDFSGMVDAADYLPIDSNFGSGVGNPLSTGVTALGDESGVSPLFSDQTEWLTDDLLAGWLWAEANAANTNDGDLKNCGCGNGSWAR